MKILSILLVLLSFTLPSFAGDQGHVFLNNNSFNYKVSSDVPVWSETQILKQGLKLGPELFLDNKIPHTHPTELGYDDQIIWTTIAVETAKDFEAGEWVLNMNPKDVFFKVYFFDAEKNLIGQFLESDSKDYAEVKVRLEKNKKYFFVVHTVRSNFISFHLIKKAFREGQKDKGGFSSGLIFGALALIFLYNCLILFGHRQKVYAYYLVYLLGMIPTIGIITGVFQWNEYLTSFVYLLTLGFTLFSYQFLAVSKHYPRSHYILYPFCFFVLLFGIGASFPIGTWFLPFIEVMSDFVMGAALVTMFGLSIYFAFKKQRGAYFYILAWMPLLIVTLYYLIRVYILQASPGRFEAFLLQLGTIAPVIVFSIGFSQHVQKLEIENALQLEKLKDAETLKNFTRIICHDIANPLTLILGYATYQKDNGGATWETVYNASQRINRLITRVRTFQAVEDKKNNILFERVTVDRILNSVPEVFDLRLKEKEVELVIEASKQDREEEIFVDPVFFESTILHNIISNAIKFSYPQSKIFLRSYAEKEKVAFEVEDEGMGIPPEMLLHIFSIEKSSSRAGTKGEKGTGFGMPLVKTFVEKMGGEILISSHVQGQGVKTGTKVMVVMKRCLYS